MKKIKIEDRLPKPGQEVLVFREPNPRIESEDEIFVALFDPHHSRVSASCWFWVNAGSGNEYGIFPYAWCPIGEEVEEVPNLVVEFLKRYNDFSKLTFGQSRFLRYFDGKWEVMEPDLHPIPPVLHVAYRGPNLARALNILAGGDPGQYFSIESNYALDQKP